jgi:hypothetical protein
MAATKTLPSAGSLIGCYLFWVLKGRQIRLAPSGFADQTSWFLFGAGLFGMMATKTGLARRLAYLVIHRLRKLFPAASGNPSALVPVDLPGPFRNRLLVIMASVALGLMEVFGLGYGSNIGTGIFITLTYTAGCFDKMVIAGPSSIPGHGLIPELASSIRKT